MKITIIIPVLNESSRIAETVRLACATGASQVIVVDGGSCDGSADLARQESCVVLESPPGRAAQQNLGAEHATGEVLLFLHADCRLSPNALTQIEVALKEDRVVGGAFRQQIEADGMLFRWLEAGNAHRIRRWKLAYGDQGIFVRAAVFRELGQFPPVRLMEDLLLMRQLRDKGRVVLLDGPLHVSPRRWQKHGVIRQTARNWLLLMAEKLGVSPNRLADYYQPHWKRAGDRSKAYEDGSSIEYQD